MISQVSGWRVETMRWQDCERRVYSYRRDIAWCVELCVLKCPGRTYGVVVVKSCMRGWGVSEHWARCRNEPCPSCLGLRLATSCYGVWSSARPPRKESRRRTHTRHIGKPTCRA